MSALTVSRKLYEDSIKEIYTYKVNPKLSFTNLKKINGILSSLKTYADTADATIIPPIALSDNLRTFINNYYNILNSYILSIDKNLSLQQGIETIGDDERNTYMLESVFSSSTSILYSYLDSDQEYFLTTAQVSLDSLAGALINGLAPFKAYFNADLFEGLINFNIAANILNESIIDKSDYYKAPLTLDRSITIGTVNINNPVDYSNTTNWKTLFINLRDKIYDYLNQNIQTYYVKNTLSASVEKVLYPAISDFDTKSLYVSNYSFEGQEVIESDGSTKIKIISNIPSGMNISFWQKHSVIYFNSQNATSRARITSVDVDNKKIVMFPYSGISSFNNKIIFLLNPEGVNFEKTFQSFSLSLSNQRLFSLEIKSGDTIIKNLDYTIEIDAFKKNYITFPIAKSDPLSNGWYLNVDVVNTTVVPNNNVRVQEITINNIKKLKIVSTGAYDNINTWINYSVQYFNLQGIKVKSKIIAVDVQNKILELDSYTGIATFNDYLTFYDAPEGINIEKTFQTFSVSNLNPYIFKLEVIKNSSIVETINFKIKDSAFQTNLIKYPIPTGDPFSNGWILNVNNPTSNNNLSTSFYRDIDTNNYVLNKNNINCSGTSLYYNLTLFDTDINDTFNVNFNYQIFSSNFSANNLTLQICYFPGGSGEVVLKTLQNINPNLNTYSDTFTANSNYVSGYRFKILFNDFNDELNISFNSIYIGKNNFTQNTVTYTKPKKFLQDLDFIFSNPNQTSTKNVFISQDEIFQNNSTTYKLKLSSEPTNRGSNISFKFSDVNSSFTWFIVSNQTITGLDPVNIIYPNLNTISTPDVSFYNDVETKEFILNKGNVTAKNSSLIHYFSIDIEDRNTQMNLSFDYKILKQNYLASYLTLEVYAINGRTETLIKTLQPLLTNYNTLNNYEDRFSTTNVTNYKFKITFTDFTQQLRISFNNFYIGKNSFNQGIITYSSPRQLIDDLFFSSTYRNSSDLFFSYSQSSTVSETGIESTSYVLKLSSEPSHVGSTKSLRFYNINSNFSWFITEQTVNGLDPVTVKDTGFEKKYYDSFISLNKQIFNILNAYTLTKIIIPPIFDEENDEFDVTTLGQKIPFSNSFFSDLFDEFKDDLTFKNDINKDPRSNFLEGKKPRDNIQKTNEWKSGGVKDLLGLKTFKKYKKELETIKKSLKKIRSVLDAIKTFISTLETLIELGEDFLSVVLDQVIVQVEKVLDNLAGTGFYFLPIFDYFITGKDATINKDFYLAGIGRDILVNPYEDNPNITVSSSFLQEIKELQEANQQLFQDDINMDANRIGLDERDPSNFSGPFTWKFPFRSTTYEEFIEIIISAFLDEGDLPELGLKLTVEKDNSGQEVTKTENTDLTKGNSSGKGYEFLSRFYPDFIRPGAPQWKSGSNAGIIIAVICLPAPENLIAGQEAFLRTALAVLKPIAYIINKQYNFRMKGKKEENLLNYGKHNFISKETDKLSELTQEKKNLIITINNLKNDLKKTPSSDTNTRNRINKAISIKNKELDVLMKKVDAQSNIVWDFINNKKEGLEDFPYSINSLVNKIELILKIEEVTKFDYSDKSEEKPNHSSSTSDPNTANIEQTADKKPDEPGFFKKGLNYVGDYFSDLYGDSLILEDALDDRGGKFSGSRGTYPDFYGVTLGSLFPGTYSMVKGFLRGLRKMNEKESVFKISEKIAGIIEDIESFINDIENIILQIDDFITMIDSILDINVSYLSIKSTNGVSDIIEQIRNATNFPNEDKRQVILGFVLGAGTIDVTGGDFNISSYFNEIKDEFNEDAKDLFKDLKLSNEEKGIKFLNGFFGI